MIAVSQPLVPLEAFLLVFLKTQLFALIADVEC